MTGGKNLYSLCCPSQAAALAPGDRRRSFPAFWSSPGATDSFPPARAVLGFGTIISNTAGLSRGKGRFPGGSLHARPIRAPSWAFRLARSQENCINQTKTSLAMPGRFYGAKALRRIFDVQKNEEHFTNRAKLVNLLNIIGANERFVTVRKGDGMLYFFQILERHSRKALQRVSD